jgi:hypothetical protein
VKEHFLMGGKKSLNETLNLNLNLKHHESWLGKQVSVRHLRAWQRSKQAQLCCLLNFGFLLGRFFDPEDGSNMFLRNVCWISVDYTALYPNRHCEGLKRFIFGYNC